MAIPASVQDFPGDDEYVAFNPDESATITYYLKKRHLFGDLKVEVYDAQGKLLSTLPGRQAAGHQPGELADAAAAAQAAAGQLAGDRLAVRPVRPAGAARHLHGQADRGRQDLHQPGAARAGPALHALGRRPGRAARDGAGALRHARPPHLRRRHGEVAGGRGPGSGPAKLPAGDRLRRQLETLAASLETFRATLVATGPGGWLSGEEQLREKMAKVYGGVNGYDGRPTQSQLDQVKVLGDQLKQGETKLAALQSGEVAAVNRELEKRKLEPLKAKTREEWEKQDGVRAATPPAFLPFTFAPVGEAEGD